MTYDTDAHRKTDLGGWNLAAVLGLLAVALVWNRVSPPERKAPPSRRKAVREAISGAPMAQGDDRGRYASSPSEIPPKGWKDILVRVSKNVSKRRVLALAAGMTYYSILAIFPAIAAVVAMYGLFSDPTTIARHLDQLGGFLPGGAIDVAREQLTRVASKGSQTLGLTFSIGLATSLWSANAAVKSLFDTLNIVIGAFVVLGFIACGAMLYRLLA
jgi:membrane protein